MPTRNLRRWLFLLLLVVGRAGAEGEPTSRTSSPVPSTDDGIVVSAIDPSVDPCDDFYRRACGGFLAAQKPDDATPAVGLSDRLFEANLAANLARLFEQDIANDPELARLKTFHASCTDDDRDGHATSLATVRRWLARIDDASTPDDLQAVIRALAAIGVDPFFGYAGQPDRTKPSRYRGEIHGSRLWADPAVVAKTFVAAGAAPADAERDAASVAAMVATLRDKRGNRYDGKTAENPRSLVQLEQLAPAIDWRRYLAMVGAPASRVVNVTSPAYLQAVQREFATRSDAELRAFLRWSFLVSLRGELPPPLDEPFGDVMPPFRVLIADTAGRCRDATIRAMGVEFSRQYAEHILGPKARGVARRMARDLRDIVVASIDQADWLSPSARRATADKLARTDLKIGFPDRWPAVGSYPLDRRRYFDNVIAARGFEQRRSWRRVGHARSRTQWDMTVSPWVGEGMAAARLVVPNGFPDALTNSLIMTAAFLAPPRFDPSAATELNYATFGAIFAHEFVHVAESHDFGPDGRDAELWSEADIRSAEERDRCVIEQADAHEPLPGLKMSGKRQFDENVADFGGVRLAALALAAKLGARIDRRDASGTSPAQRFFYRYAQNYCTAQTDAQRRQSIAADSHGPPAFRVNGPLSNLDAFRRAFACKAGAPMVRAPAEQCRVW